MASNKKKEYLKNKDHEGVLKIFKQLFGDLLDTEIITSVAHHQNWDLHETIRVLSGLTSGNVPKQAPKKQNQSFGLNSVSYNLKDDDADVVIEGETHNNQSNTFVLFPAPPTKNYSKVVGKKPQISPKNNMPLNTGTKKKQLPTKTKSKKDMEIERVRSEILKGYQVLVVLRGLPGSGKSYLAKYLATSTVPGDYRTFVYSTDDYFITGGVYKHNLALLPEAHIWNQRRVLEAAQLGMSPIIIDNTNTQAWEVRNYAMTAVRFGYQIEILEPSTPWLNEIHQLSVKNTHNVPKSKISEMKERYEVFTTNKLFTMYSLKYPPGKTPPQMRRHPPVQTKQSPKPIQNAVPLIPKQKKQKKQNKRTPQPQTNRLNIASNDNVSVSNSESQDQLSGTWDSDTEGTWEEIDVDANKNQEQSNLLFTENFDMEYTPVDSYEYVLVKPDNTLIYQKNHSSPEKEMPDLISFNDSDEKIGSLFQVDNINNQRNENKVFDRKLSLLDVEFHSTENVKYDTTENQDNKLSEEFDHMHLKEKPTHTDYNATDYTRRLLSTLQNNLNFFKFAPKVVETPLTKKSIVENKVESKEIGTSTISTDFIDSGRSNMNDKILLGTPRILSGINCIKQPLLPPKKLMLERGTMTSLENILENVNNQNTKINDFRTLLNLFPQLDEEVLRDIFDKCQNDVNWAVDLLLENGAQASSTIEGDRNPKEEIKMIEETASSQRDTTEEETNVQEFNKHSRIKNKATNDPLKKHLEEQFIIGDKHHSEHVLNLRKKRYGINETYFGESSSSSKDLEQTEPMQQEQEDDLEMESDEEFVEMNFGKHFIQQLHGEFGNTDTDYLDGLLPVMQLPVSLARQLYVLWMESAYSQIEMKSNLIQEVERQDAELAKHLQEEEERLVNAKEKPQVTSLQEIMDMEFALATYRTDQDRWRNEAPDDLASKMTRQKLFEAFPQLDKDVLCEILQAHNYCFEETVESLMSSVGGSDKFDNVNGKIVPKNTSITDEAAKQKQLLEQAKNDLRRKKILNYSRLGNIDDDSEDEIEICKKGAKFYRDRAAYHLNMRHKLYKNANESIKKGQHQVATYYSDVAKLHMQKYEIENNRAATAFLSQHSMKHNNGKILDLHYLYTREAEQAIGVFLDNQISNLRQSKRLSETVFIITGRGKNSAGGIAHIKPAIKKCLRDRKLKFSEMNPGSLKVIIHKHSLLTNDL